MEYKLRKFYSVNFTQRKIFVLTLCTKRLKIYLTVVRVLLWSQKLLISNSSNHSLRTDLQFVIIYQTTSTYPLKTTKSNAPLYLKIKECWWAETFCTLSLPNMMVFQAMTFNVCLLFLYFILLFWCHQYWLFYCITP